MEQIKLKAARHGQQIPAVDCVRERGREAIGKGLEGAREGRGGMGDGREGGMGDGRGAAGGRELLEGGS